MNSTAKAVSYLTVLGIPLVFYETSTQYAKIFGIPVPVMAAILFLGFAVYVEKRRKGSAT